jgi:hypothetical protein
LYDQGHGVPQDYAQAAIWYRRAAEQGNVAAQANLSKLYEDGRGVLKNYAEAYFWIDLAASSKLEGATWRGEAIRQQVIDKEREDAASHLTPAELSRVQERARKWFEDHPAKPQ